jgi:hypothetical protein
MADMEIKIKIMDIKEFKVLSEALAEWHKEVSERDFEFASEFPLWNAINDIQKSVGKYN